MNKNMLSLKLLNENFHVDVVLTRFSFRSAKIENLAYSKIDRLVFCWNTNTLNRYFRNSSMS